MKIPLKFRYKYLKNINNGRELSYQLDTIRNIVCMRYLVELSERDKAEGQGKQKIEFKFYCLKSEKERCLG
jgi:hypothetical protein